MHDDQRHPSKGQASAHERVPLISSNGVTSSEDQPKHLHHAHSSGAGNALEIEESFLTSAPVEFTHPFSIWQRRYVTVLFTLMASLLFADQNLLAPNLSSAAAYFGFDETEKDEKLGGYISAAFFAVGAPAALLVGWYADKVNRRNLLFAVAVLGQAPCLCTIWVTKYWQFFILRILTGISVGGAFPLLYSLLGDLFPISQRTLVSSFIQIATGAGVFLGQMMAALIGPATNWRMPFVVVAAPSLVVALVMLCTTQDPPRGACEEAVQAQHPDAASPYSETITWAKIKLLLMVPSNWLIFMQGFPGSLPWGMFIAFLNDYLQIRNNFSAATATLIVTVFGLGNAVGVVGGGAVGQLLYNRKKEWMPLLAGTCVLAGIGPTLYLVNADLSQRFGVSLFMAAFAGVLAAVAGPCVKAVVLNVNDPEARGVALALQTMTDDLGKALGPFIVAGFIRELGRQGAFSVSVCGWFPCGLMILGLAFCIRRDEEAMQERLKDKLHASQSTAAALGGGPDDVYSPVAALQPLEPFPAQGFSSRHAMTPPGRQVVYDGDHRYGGDDDGDDDYDDYDDYDDDDDDGRDKAKEEKRSRAPLLPVSHGPHEPLRNGFGYSSHLDRDNSWGGGRSQGPPGLPAPGAPSSSGHRYEVPIDGARGLDVENNEVQPQGNGFASSSTA